MSLSAANLDFLKTLAEARPELFAISALGELPTVVHDEHRWTLPVLWLARERGLVPASCLLVVFDSHHDAVAPRQGVDRLRAFVNGSAQDLTAALELGTSALCELNDDWICASMELGLVGDAVVIGVEEQWDAPKAYTDANGTEHRIFYLSHPSSAFGYQGSLSDVVRTPELQPMWDVLGWQRAAGGVFQLASGGSPIVVSIDLDCFRMVWDDYQMPWPRQAFEDRYQSVADYFSTAGWTGRQLVRGLLNRAALLDIAREPKHCGGYTNSLRILSKLQRFVFGARLSEVQL